MECMVKDLAVHFDVCGQGMPFLLLHGYRVDSRLMAGCFEPVFERLEGYRRVYIDLPGMGRTKRADWIRGADDMLALLLEFIERVMPGERFLLAGESYGGYLARGVVRRLGERVAGLHLLCPVILPGFKERALPPRAVLKTDGALLASLSPEDAKSFTESIVIQTRKVWERFRDEVLCGLRVADQPYLERYRKKGYAFTFDVDAMDKPFLSPALFLMGRQDDGVGYRDAWAILENYPRATFAVLDRSGHNLQIEQPALFRALTLEWLDRVREASQRQILSSCAAESK